MHIVIKEYGLIQRKYIVLHNALKQRHIGYLAMHKAVAQRVLPPCSTDS